MPAATDTHAGVSRAGLQGTFCLWTYSSHGKSVRCPSRQRQRVSVRVEPVGGYRSATFEQLRMHITGLVGEAASGS